MTYSMTEQLCHSALLTVFAVGALLLSAHDCATQLIPRYPVFISALIVAAICGPQAPSVCTFAFLVGICMLTLCAVSQHHLGRGDVWCTAFFSMPISFSAHDFLTAATGECSSLALAGFIGLVWSFFRPDRASPLPFVPPLAIGHACTLLVFLAGNGISH
jgi:prepilin signal peptidase PulO-like enzyme (type II secretory pathway)